MGREMCAVLIVASLCGGCARKSAPPETGTAKVPQAPAVRAPAGAPKTSEPSVAPKPAPVVINPAEATDPVKAARLFLQAVGSAPYDQAVALCVPGKFTSRGFAQMNVAFQMDQASVSQAWAGGKLAAVITSFVPTKQGAAAGVFWGLKLVPTEGGRWGIHNMDVLPNQEAMDKYLATFRESAPDAKSVPLQP